MANSDSESNISLSTFIPSSIRLCSVHELQSNSSARNDCEDISESLIPGSFASCLSSP